MGAGGGGVDGCEIMRRPGEWDGGRGGGGMGDGGMWEYSMIDYGGGAQQSLKNLSDQYDTTIITISLFSNAVKHTHRKRHTHNNCNDHVTKQRLSKATLYLFTNRTHSALNYNYELHKNAAENITKALLICVYSYNFS